MDNGCQPPCLTFWEEWCVGHGGIHAFSACEAFASNLEKRGRDGFGNGGVTRGGGDAGVLAPAS